MTAITDLESLLKGANPRLHDRLYVFATFPGARYGDLGAFKPIAAVQESEGLTLVLEQSVAVGAGLDPGPKFRLISLGIHSSLEAVGLTAAVAGCLAKQGIPANMLAAYYHDHILVPAAQAETALKALQEMCAP